VFIIEKKTNFNTFRVLWTKFNKVGHILIRQDRF
jgi:hypothetical protein